MKRWYVTLASSLPPIALAALAALGKIAPSVAWVGACIALLALPLRIGLYYVVPQPRTHPAMPGLIAVSALGVALSVTGAGRALPASLAAAGFANTLAYLFWYTRLSRSPPSRLRVGGALPAFELVSLDGSTVEARALCDRPAVWIFFRGNWCPLCSAQVREAVATFQEIEAHGARVVLVSAQPQERTAELARRLRVRFDFMVDRDARAARQLGVLHEAALPGGFEWLGYELDAALPTVFVTDTAAVIRYLHETTNYRVRPSPSEWLRVVAELAPDVPSPLVSTRR